MGRVIGDSRWQGILSSWGLRYGNLIMGDGRLGRPKAGKMSNPTKLGCHPSPIPKNQPKKGAAYRP
jgi:hypothetical protein